MFAMIFISVVLVPAISNAENIHLFWGAPTDGSSVAGYYLYYGQSQDIETMTRIGPIYSTDYIIELNNVGKVYYFYVKAFNSAGEGAPSVVKTVNIHLQVQ